MYPIDAVRRSFPSLSRSDNGVPRVYLDNPAGTQVPARVAEAAAHAMIERNANLGGFFRTSRLAEETVQRAHEAMAIFLNARSYREIVVAQSMTNLTLHLSRSIGRTLRTGDEIVVTRTDHDGNIGPWLLLAEDLGLRVRFVPFDERTWRVEPDRFAAEISDRTAIAAINYASNLTGSINDVRTLVALARDRGALTYVDAVQYAPHRAIDVRHLECDALLCSSYKFFGPHLGIAYVREALLGRWPAYKVRPATSDLPWKFETGTPQIELLAALAETVDYVASIGTPAEEDAGESGNESSLRHAIVRSFQRTAAWERTLARRLIDGLERIHGIRILGITDEADSDARVPTVSFVHERFSPPHIAQALAGRNIFVWSGNNYALELVRQLGLNEDEGVVRIGMAHYNTPDEIDTTLAALEDVLT